MRRTASGPPPGPAMRVPPHSLDLERAILATALTEPATLDVCERLRAEHFYSDANGALWTAILGARARGLTPDHITVRDELVRVGKLASIGGDETLFEITNRILPTYQPEEQAREVIELAQRRAVVMLCHDLASRGYDRAIDTAEYLESAQQRIFEATASVRAEGSLEHIDPLPIMQRIEDIATGKVYPMGSPTGLAVLDEKLRGYDPGALIILAGRPGMGKTALALGAARATARGGDRTSAVFSLEMTKLELEERYVSLAAGVPSDAIKTGQLEAGHFPRIGNAAAEMKRIPLFIDDTAGLSIPQIRARLRRMVSKSGVPLGLIVVDHIGLARSGMRTGSREQEVSEIARALKEIGKEFKAPVLALSQLNRECEKTNDKRPSLHHLRDSGEIEQSADVVLFVYRRGYYAAEKKAGRLKEDRFSQSEIEADDDDGKAEIIIAKRRGGATGTVHCMFEGECTRFVDYGHNDYRPDARVRDGGEPWAP